MDGLCEEIAASLYRSRKLIEQETYDRMYFYNQARSGMPHAINNKKESTPAVPSGTINSIRLKKYWNLFPKKKNKKPSDGINSTTPRFRDKFGTVSGSVTAFHPPSYNKTPAKDDGTLVSPWESYSTVPDVIFEESSDAKSDGAVVRNNFGSVSSVTTTGHVGCTCGTPSRIYGTVRAANGSAPRLYGTTRPSMNSSNRKSIFSRRFGLGNDEPSDDDEVAHDDDGLDSDTAYSSMYESSPVSSAKNKSLGRRGNGADGKVQIRKSILECDVNPYDLVRRQKRDSSDASRRSGQTLHSEENDLLEEDDLSIKVAADPDGTPRTNKRNRNKKDILSRISGKGDGGDDDEKDRCSRKGLFSAYGKSGKGTLRIGGRAMNFNWQKERKMPKSSAESPPSSPPAHPPRRSISVPDIHSASIFETSVTFEPEPERARKSVVPNLARHYERLGPKVTGSSSNISVLPSVVNRMARTPSPTRKASTPFQSNGVIYGISPLRRPRAPPPPPPVRKFNGHSAEDDDSARNSRSIPKTSSLAGSDRRDTKMETIDEKSEEATATNSSETRTNRPRRKSSFDGQTDIRSILSKSSASTNDFKFDSCSEASSSAYGSISSHSDNVGREVKSILKKNRSFSESATDTSGSSRSSYSEESQRRRKKKQVKFKASSDNNIIIENINDKLPAIMAYLEEEDEDDFGDVDEEEEDDDTGSDVTLQQSTSEGFVSVGDCVIGTKANSSKSNVAKVNGVRFGSWCESLKNENATTPTTTPTPTSGGSIVGRTRSVFETNASDKFHRNRLPKIDEVSSSSGSRENLRSDATDPSKSSSVSSANGSMQNETSATSGLAEFPEFDPDVDWKSSKTTTTVTSSSSSLSKNVDGSPTETKIPGSDVMARGREPETEKSAKYQSKVLVIVPESPSTDDLQEEKSQGSSAGDDVRVDDRQPSSTVRVDVSSWSGRYADETTAEPSELEEDSGKRKNADVDGILLALRSGREVDVISGLVKNDDESIYDTITSGRITCTYVTDSTLKNTEILSVCDESAEPKTHTVENKDRKKCCEFVDDVVQVEDSEIDRLYEDIAGLNVADDEEPIYEELQDNNVINPSPKPMERKSIFEGASKTEILSILNSAKRRVLNDSDGTASINSISSLSNSSMPNKYVIVEEGYDESVTCNDDLKLEIKKNFRNRPSRLSNLSNLSNSSSSSSSEEKSESGELSRTRSDKLLGFVSTTSLRRRRGSAEIERNDSGVGSETSKPSKVRRHSSTDTAYFFQNSLDELMCEDCDQQIEGYESVDTYFPLVCEKCQKRRLERREIIAEIVETEIKYGNDLKILKEEFYRPMEVAGLLTCDQLQSLFINLDELRKMNFKFVEKLRDALEIANEQGDEDYLTVSVGRLFLESTPMLHGFETYCVQQSSASMLLSHLEKEKELLRIFLCVSQMENTLLRRMNLPAFLMVPVQRVTKYPLLLNRLYKVTPHHHKDRDALRDAQRKIELHLEHINLQTKGIGTTKIWRKISNISIAHRRSHHIEEVGNIKLRTMALELLQWNREEVKFVKEGRLLYTQPPAEYAKKSKSFKFSSVHALLVTLGRPDLTNSRLKSNDGSKDTCEATLLLVKEKGNRLTLLREPLHLKNCVVSTDLQCTETFEVHLVTSKDFFICKSESKDDTEEWAKELRSHAKDHGRWRQRRNALANIMISGMNRH